MTSIDQMYFRELIEYVIVKCLKKSWNERDLFRAMRYAYNESDLSKRLRDCNPKVNTFEDWLSSQLTWGQIAPTQEYDGIIVPMNTKKAWETRLLTKYGAGALVELQPFVNRVWQVESEYSKSHSGRAITIVN